MENQVLLFLRNYTRNKLIDRGTILNNLGYSGLDALKLMSDFFDEFDISNSEDFEIYSFFMEELSFLDFLTKSYKKRFKEKKHLKISHLIKVVEKGKWFDP